MICSLIEERCRYTKEDGSDVYLGQMIKVLEHWDANDGQFQVKDGKVIF